MYYILMNVLCRVVRGTDFWDDLKVRRLFLFDLDLNSWE